MSKYELLERIGVGGMAEIYRGKSLSVGGFEKLVAIKKILPHLGRDERFVQMLIHEARINASLRQRNIVQIYDVGVGDDGEYFLVMEYVAGRDLATLMKALEHGGRFELPLEVALFIAGEVCDALEHAHRAVDSKGRPFGLIHRDVSPANVLVSYAGEVKLTDFGIAKKIDEASVVASIKGKFAYMSPEQAAARPLDGRSDLFALGIMLWELCVGKRLFSGMSDFDALRAVREAKIQRPRDAVADFDKQLDRIIMKTLAPKAEDRYERAADLASELRDVRFRVAGAASPAAELAAMVKNQFPPAEHDRIALEAPAPPLPAPAPVLAPVASSSAGPRQRSFVEISTAAGFMPFQGPGAAVAPDAAINQLLVPPDETRVLRKPPPAQPALAPPPPPPPPAARAKKAKRPSTVELRDERSARLHRELFDDVSSLQRAPGERPPTVSKLPTSPAAAVMAGAQLPGVTDDAPTRFHQAAPPAKPSENTDEIDEDDEVESERARRVRIGVVLGALTLIVVIILAWAAGYLG